MKSQRSQLIYFIRTAGLVLAAVIIVGTVGHYSIKRKATPNNYSDVENIAETVETAATYEVAAPVPISPPEKLPEKKLLKIGFASQAPFGDWSEPYENACEEASIIMVEHFLKNSSLTNNLMKQEIDSSVAWQIQAWGNHADLNAEKTLELARNYFRLTGEIVTVDSIVELKELVAEGQPILIPSAGRKLGNPNFRGVGPEYHMLVIKGYDDSQGVFIANDPGTRKGESYIYKYDVLYSAISGPKEDMQKTIIILDQ